MKKSWDNYRTAYIIVAAHEATICAFYNRFFQVILILDASSHSVLETKLLGTNEVDAEHFALVHDIKSTADLDRVICQSEKFVPGEGCKIDVDVTRGWPFGWTARRKHV